MYNLSMYNFGRLAEILLKWSCDCCDTFIVYYIYARDFIIALWHYIKVLSLKSFSMLAYFLGGF